jgi:hypothetical protein
VGGRTSFGRRIAERRKSRSPFMYVGNAQIARGAPSCGRMLDAADDGAAAGGPADCSFSTGGCSLHTRVLTRLHIDIRALSAEALGSQPPTPPPVP